MPYSRILLNLEQIDEIVTRLSKEISPSLSEQDDPLALVVLDGATYFARDLLAKLDLPMDVEYIKASSYSGTRSSGTVTVQQDTALKDTIRGRDILLVDDIYDTGRTLSHILAWLTSCKTKNVKTCVLLEKDIPHAMDVNIDFIGTKIEDEFLIGYGLDHNGRHRELPFIGVLCEETISREEPSCNP